MSFQYLIYMFYSQLCTLIINLTSSAVLMHNISKQAFQSNVIISAIFQNFNPRGKSTHGKSLKAAHFHWKKCILGNPMRSEGVRLSIVRVSFIVSSLRHTCAIIMLSNQHLDMLHLWGGWLSRSLTQIYTDLWTIFERNRPFVFIEKSSAHEKWDKTKILFSV